jgi:hypothetical protein
MTNPKLPLGQSQSVIDDIVADYILKQIPELALVLPHDDDNEDNKDHEDIKDLSGTAHEFAISNDLEEDPAHNNLNEKAKKLYIKANKAYRLIVERKYPYIKINSGKRTTHQQAELYENYIKSLYGGPSANAANKPGKSFHEYGLAIDVVRKDDEENLTDALTGAGWVKAHEDEGWHFEAQGIDDWNTIEKKIRENVYPFSQRFAEDLVVYYENKKRVDEKEPLYKKDRDSLMSEKTSLDIERSTLEHRRFQLMERQTILREEDEAIRQEQSQVRKLLEQHNNMIYNRCPEGQPYETCTHEELKQAFNEEKKKLLIDYRRRATALNDRQRSQQENRLNWSKDMSTYSNDFKSYQEQIENWKSRLLENDKLKQKIENWRKEMNVRLSHKEKNLSEILEAVSKI